MIKLTTKIQTGDRTNALIEKWGKGGLSLGRILTWQFSQSTKQCWFNFFYR